MNRVLVSTKAVVSESRAIAVPVRQIPEYAICAGLGLLGGATGVAIAIGLVISISLALRPTAAFSPGTVPLMVMAVVAGLGVTWLLSRGMRQVVPGLGRNWQERGLQLTLVCSAFTGLLQTILFFA